MLSCATGYENLLIRGKDLMHTWSTQVIIITMIYTHKHKDVVWLDLENPTKDEVRGLIEKYDINPIVAEELLTPSNRSRVDLHKDYIYLILHFPQKITDHGSHVLKPNTLTCEVDFIISKNFIITTRYTEIDALLEFSKLFEINSVLDRSNISQHAGYIFYYMIKNIYKTMFEEIQNVKDTLSEYEEKIFSGKEREMVIALSHMNRLLLYYKDSLLFHKEVLSSFEIAGRKIFEEEFSYYLSAITGEYYKVQNSLETSKDYLKELRETNDSLLSSKQNEVMKNLTVMAFIVLPLSLIAGIFGMNTVNTPLVGSDRDFYLVLGIMLLSAFISFVFFRKKGWI